MSEKLIVPRRKVKKDWYEGLSPDHIDRTQNDVHDEALNIVSPNITSNSTWGLVHGM